LEVAALQAKLIALTKKSAELEDGMNQQKLEIEQKTAELEDGMKQRQLEIEALTKQTMKQQLAIEELREQVEWLSWTPWPWED
jgi:predicted RNase H-like nuclease (RuvC/YqgF family)